MLGALVEMFAQYDQPPLEPPEPSDPIGHILETSPSASAPIDRGTAASAEPRQHLPAAFAQVSEDLRTPWDWVDLVIFALLAIGGTFLISVVLVFVFSAIGINPARLRASATAKSYFAIVNQILVSLGLLGFLAAQTNARTGTPFWRTIGWRPLVTRQVPKAVVYASLVAAGFLLSMFVQFASSFSLPKTKLPIETFFQDRGSALLLMLVSVLLAPVLEETIFRGFIYPVIARGFGILASVIITGTLFGLLHSAQLWGGWLQIGMLVVVGITFTYVRAVTRTVIASYLLHLSYNSFLFLVFLVSSHWLRKMPPGY